MYLVDFVKKYFSLIISDKRFRNSIWMVLEKGISLIGLIFVISAMVKYIGPKTYGYIALATSIFLIIKSISQLGLDQIYFKHISKGNVKKNLFLKNSILLILIIYISFSTIVFYIYSSSIKLEELILFSSICLAYLFLSIDIKSIHLDAVLQSKFNVAANIFGLVISLIFRYIVIHFNLSVSYFAIPIILLTAIPFFIRKYFFYKYKLLIDEKNKIIFFRRYSRYILKVGTPLALSVLAINIYLQSANFILAKVDSIESVGKYSVAVMLAGCWYFLPTTFILSFLPKIYEAKEYSEYLNKSAILLRWLIISTLIIVLILYFSAEYLIDFLYGSDYQSSVLLFKILLFSHFFSILGFYFYRLIVKFSGYGFLAKKMIVTTVLNLVLTYYMVVNFGVVGAAISALITEIFSNLFFNLFFKKLMLLSLIKKALLGGKNE